MHKNCGHAILLIKVATLVTRHDDLTTSDKCWNTESSSGDFSWNRTSSNYFCRFEISRWFWGFSTLFRPSWSAVDSFTIKTVYLTEFFLSKRRCVSQFFSESTSYRAFIFIKFNATYFYMPALPFGNLFESIYLIKVSHGRVVFTIFLCFLLQTSRYSRWVHK